METSNKEVLENESEKKDISLPDLEEELEQVNKRNKMPLFIVLAIVVLLLIVAFGMMFARSKEHKFIELLLKDQTIFEIMSKNEKLYKENAQVDSEFIVTLEDFVEITGADIKFDEIAVESSSMQEKDRDYTVTKMKIDDEEILEWELLRVGNTYGIRLKDLYEKFVAVKNEDLKKVAEKLGSNGTELPEHMVTKEDWKTVMKMKDSDFEAIAKKYRKTFENAIQGKVTAGNDKIMINGKEMKVKKYTLSMDMETLYNLIKGVLETLKDDKKNIELVCGDIVQVINLYEENGYDVDAFLSKIGFTKEDFEDTKKIQEVFQESYETLIENKRKKFNTEDKVEFIVYEKGGKTVKTAMRAEDYEISVSALQGKENIIVFDILEYDDLIRLSYITKQNKEDKDLVVEGGISLEINDIKIKIFESKEVFKKQIEKKVPSIEEMKIINDATDKELEEFKGIVEENKDNFIKKLGESIEKTSGVNPFAVEENISDIIKSTNSDWIYDIYYLSQSNIEIINKAKEAYNKVEGGVKKEDLIKILGEPDASYIKKYRENLYWKFGEIGVLGVEISMLEEIVTQKDLSFIGVALGEELNTTLEDLKLSRDKVKEGMTLSQVEEILGNGYIESSKDFEYNRTNYTWYDKKENSLVFRFEDGRFSYIVSLW